MAGNRTNRKWWTLGAVCVATFMLLLDITVVNTALPKIQQDLGGSFSDLQWVIDAYALSLAALVLTAGSLADCSTAAHSSAGWRSSPPPRCSARSLPTRPSSTSPVGYRDRRRDHVRGQPRAPSPRSSPAASSAAWRWGSTFRSASRSRSGRWSVASSPTLRLAVGLPRQRAGRDRDDRGHLLEAARVP